MKFTFGPKEMRSPLGIVSKWLSSSTEFSDSIHYADRKSKDEKTKDENESERESSRKQAVE